MTNSQHSLNAIAVRFTWFLNTDSTASGAFTDRFARWSKLVACFGCGIVLALPASIRAQAASEISTPRAIEVGAAQGGQLDAGKTLRWRIDVPAGNVVQGDFNGPGATLDLVDRHGVHIRRLADGENSPQTLTFQVHNGQQLQVQAGTLGTPFTLQLRRSLPLATKSVTDHSGLESPRLATLTRELSQGASTAGFWDERRANGAPMVEPLSATESLVTFLWRGTSHTRSVRLFGSPSGDHDPLKRLGDSDVWWASFRMPNTARLSYRLAPDVPQIQGSTMDQRRMMNRPGFRGGPLV